MDALVSHEGSVRRTQIDKSGSRTMDFDSAVFAGDLGIIQNDIGSRPSQYHSSLAQTKNLAPTRPLDDGKRHSLTRGKLWKLRRSIDHEAGVTLLALSLQLGFARELLLIHRAVRATMGTFDFHIAWFEC